MPIKAQAILSKITEKTGGLQLFITLLIVVLLIYQSINTRLIPSSNMLNITDANNQTVQVKGIYSYVYKEYIPQRDTFENENKEIPKTSFQNGAVPILIGIILLTILNMRKHLTETLLTIEEVEIASKNYLNRMIDLKKIQSYTLHQNAFLRNYQISDGEKKPDIWWQGAEVVTYDGEYQYRMIGWNPFHPARLMSDLETHHKFKASDVCPSCGEDHLCNQRFIDTTGFSKWKEMFSRKGTM